MGNRWYELGVELLDEDQLTQLDIINTDNNEVTRRCAEMFLFWLETHPTATWQNLVDALKAPGVELNDVAVVAETNIHLSASQSSGRCMYIWYHSEVTSHLLETFSSLLTRVPLELVIYQIVSISF